MLRAPATAAAGALYIEPPWEVCGGRCQFPTQCPFLLSPLTKPHFYSRQPCAHLHTCFSRLPYTWVTPLWPMRCKQAEAKVYSGFWESFCFSAKREQIGRGPPLSFLAYKQMSHLQLWQSSCDPEAMSMGTKTSFLRNCLVTASTPASAQF